MDNLILFLFFLSTTGVFLVYTCGKEREKVRKTTGEKVEENRTAGKRVFLCTYYKGIATRYAQEIFLEFILRTQALADHVNLVFYMRIEFHIPRDFFAGMHRGGVVAPPKFSADHRKRRF